MTSEEAAFIAAIDAEPENHFLREVYADWLEERNDPRAAGYRAMGRLGIAPWHLRPTSSREHDHWMWQLLPRSGREDTSDSCTFDSRSPEWTAWFRLMCPGGVFGDHYGHHRGGRRGAEDAAALAWAKLTPEQQAAILAASYPREAPNGI